MKREKGFTLIELVMVIVILGILAAVAMPKYVNMQDEAKSAAAKGVIGTIRSAIAIQYAKTALSGTPAFPVIADAAGSTSGSNDDLQLYDSGASGPDGNSIFTENKMPDSPVDKGGKLNDIVAGSNDPISTFNQSTAYVYNESTGEIRFNNTDTDPITQKAWNTF